MKKRLALLIAAFGFTSMLSADNLQNGAGQMSTTMDCTNMSPDMQAFASKLSANNKMVFCGKMTDGQRAMSVQMANQMDPSGKPVMTPDQAVEKVGQGMNAGTPKGPSGCPVK
jgi:hypothetical protein